jgi:acetyltransferase-like isoleucine patch superfamily enzyme
MHPVIQWRDSSKTLPATVGRDVAYFTMRGTWLDCRGPLTIHKTAAFGFGVKILTMSHDMSGGEFMARVVKKPVIIDEGAQIYSFSLLYNCHIMHHAVVACGSVVRSMTVEPWTMVEGNPARVIKKWDGERWMSAT